LNYIYRDSVNPRGTLLQQIKKPAQSGIAAGAAGSRLFLNIIPLPGRPSVLSLASKASRGRRGVGRLIPNRTNITQARSVKVSISAHGFAYGQSTGISAACITRKKLGRHHRFLGCINKFYVGPIGTDQTRDDVPEGWRCAKSGFLSFACYANNDGKFSRPPPTFDIRSSKYKTRTSVELPIDGANIHKKRGELR
jgi:hypothetical protein